MSDEVRRLLQNLDSLSDVKHLPRGPELIPMSDDKSAMSMAEFEEYIFATDKERALAGEVERLKGELEFCQDSFNVGIGRDQHAMCHANALLMQQGRDQQAELARLRERVAQLGKWNAALRDAVAKVLYIKSMGDESLKEFLVEFEDKARGLLAGKDGT